jgi:CHAD domain-containing protein
MKEREKLRVLLPHWIKHNEEHVAEFRQWAERVAEASEDITAAAHQMEVVNRSLRAALEKLGGPMEPRPQG